MVVNRWECTALSYRLPLEKLHGCTILNNQCFRKKSPTLSEIKMERVVFTANPQFPLLISERVEPVRLTPPFLLALAFGVNTAI